MSQDWVRVVAQLTLEADAEALDETLDSRRTWQRAWLWSSGGGRGGAVVDVVADVDVVVGVVVVVERDAFLAVGELEPQAAARSVTASRAKAACEARRRR